MKLTEASSVLKHTHPRHIINFLKKIRVVEHDIRGVDGPHWIWTGALDTGNRTEYGKMKVGGKTVRAHRWAYEVFVRKLKIDEDAHHECGESLCVNPCHITPLPCEQHSKRPAPSNAFAEPVPF